MFSFEISLKLTWGWRRMLAI